MTLQTKERVAWVDIAKAISILLVVFGHVLRGGMAQKIVFSFHVPAFFMLSGMTCKADRIKEQIKNDFLRIMVPYYIFGIASILIFCFLGKFSAHQLQMTIDTSLTKNLWDLLCASTKGDGLRFNLPLWFLPCLFVTKLFYYGLSKLCRGKQLPILICSLIAAVLGFIYTRLNGPVLPFNLSVAVKMLIYFSLGRSFFIHITERKSHSSSGYQKILIGIVALAVAGVVAGIVPRVNYADDTFPVISAFLVASLLGGFGICFLSMGIDHCRLLEYVGRGTLAILVMHKFPVLLFQTVGPLKTVLANYDSIAGISASVAVSIIAVILCLGVACIINRFVPFALGNCNRKITTRL